MDENKNGGVTAIIATSRDMTAESGFEWPRLMAKLSGGGVVKFDEGQEGGYDIYDLIKKYGPVTVRMATDEEEREIVKLYEDWSGMLAEIRKGKEFGAQVTKLTSGMRVITMRDDRDNTYYSGGGETSSFFMVREATNKELYDGIVQGGGSVSSFRELRRMAELTEGELISRIDGRLCSDNVRHNRVLYTIVREITPEEFYLLRTNKLNKL